LPPVEPPISPLNKAEPAQGPPPDFSMVRAAEATRRAEAMQRDPRLAAQLAVDRHVDAHFGNLSHHKREFLKQRPDYWADEHSMLAMSRRYYAGLAAGIPDDTPEMNAYIDDGMRQEFQERQQHRVQGARAAAPMPPPIPEPSVDRMAERLNQQQADAIRNVVNVEASTPMVLAENLPMPRARSLPISAPVSREIPTASGQKAQDFSNIRLSPIEREIARNSFGPIKDAFGNVRDLTNEEKELRYGLNKLRMLKMRADGTLNE
jgi:hypothetical protein